MFVFAWIFTHLVVFIWIQFYISSTLLLPHISKYDTFSNMYIASYTSRPASRNETNEPFGSLGLSFFFQTLGFVVTSKCWAQDSEWLLKTCVQPAYLDNGRHGVPWWTAVGQGCWLEMGYLIKRSTPTYPTFIDMIFHMINTRVLFLKFICVEHSTFFLWYIDYMHVFIPFYKKKAPGIISWSWHWS